MKNQFLVTAIFLVFYGIHLDAQRVEDNVSYSNKIEQILDETPAFNRELIINIKGDSIAAYAFIASGSKLKETVILIPGYPGNDSNFDVAQELRRNGRNVIHFNHRGAWGSQGIYSYSNCLEDVEHLIHYLSNTKVSAELTVDTNHFCLLGRSYGGGIALIQGNQIDAVKKIIAISSVNYGNIMKKYKSLEELSGFRNYMKKQIMMNHDIDQFLEDLFINQAEYDISKYSNALGRKNVLIIEDSEKNLGWINQLSDVESVIMKTDHNFIDKTIELTDLIKSWLDNH